MMGIAFIGAIVGHVDRVAAGAPPAEILEKVEAQLDKKFGRKGATVVEGNMAVIRDGIEAGRVDYDAPEFVAIDEGRRARGSPWRCRRPCAPARPPAACSTRPTTRTS